MFHSHRRWANIKHWCKCQVLMSFPKNQSENSSSIPSPPGRNLSQRWGKCLRQKPQHPQCNAASRHIVVRGLVVHTWCFLQCSWLEWNLNETRLITGFQKKAFWEMQEETISVYSKHIEIKCPQQQTCWVVSRLKAGGGFVSLYSPLNEMNEHSRSASHAQTWGYIF